MSKKKPNLTLPARVEKIIPALYGPEKAQIAVEGADDLYREIRVENVVTDEKGKESNLKQGQDVDVVLEADTDSNETKS